MVPFASFKGSRWSTPWPASTRSRELPIDIESVPEDWWGGEAPGPLTVHLPGDVERPVTIRAPRVYRSFCQTRLGIVTDYRSDEPIPLPPPNPYPKDGLGAAGRHGTVADRQRQSPGARDCCARQDLGPGVRQGRGPDTAR